jgi:hypothetical protein
MSRLYKLTLVMILIAGVLALANRGMGAETAVLASKQSEIPFDGSFIETGFIQASDGANGNHFGRAVAVDGDTMVIGAFGTRIDGNVLQGAAYVFTRSGTDWIAQQKLVADDGAASHHFGAAVAVEGDTILVGAYLADGAGAVYVFTRSGATWSQQQKLVADDGVSGSSFGLSLALEGDTAVIGAPASGNLAGAVYLFGYSETTWSQQQKLTASDAALRFGSAVALDGDTIVVGAQQPFAQGAAYVFIRDGSNWHEQQKLTAGDGVDSDQFGSAVALSGHTVFVGAYRANIGQNNQGAAYVFTRDGAIWSQQQKLTAADGAEGNRFGIAITLDGHRALIGAPIHMAHGAVYYFARDDTSWSQQQKLIPGNGSSGESFGAAVDLDGETAVIGAAWAFTSPSPEGGAYIFTWRPPFNPTDFIYLPYITR